MKKGGILKNAAILFAAMFITKILSAALKIPLANILGGTGMGYFSAAYSLFSPVYALTAAALPTVIMRMTAREAALGKYKNVRKIRKIGLFAAFALGLSGTAAMLLFAAPFSEHIANSPRSLPSMLIIAPSLFFCCFSAVYRGYYEGLSNMLPTAVSQIIEAVVKSSVGIVLAYYTVSLGYSVSYAAAAAVAGVSAGELCGLLFLFARSRFFRDGITAAALKASPAPQKSADIIKAVITDALPVTLAALAMNLNPFIDMLTISNCVNSGVLSDNAYFLQNFTYGFQNGPALADIGDFAYGCYAGVVTSLFSLATSVTAIIGRSALPEITAAYGGGDRPGLVRNLKILFKGTLLLGLPLCFGLAALASPLLKLLYYSKPAEAGVSALPLTVLSLGGAALIISGMLFSVFLAIGRVDIQIRLMLIGAAVKLAGNLTFIKIPQLNLTGAAVSTVMCYAVVTAAGLISLKRLVPEKIGITRFFAIPLGYSVACAFTAYVCYARVFANMPDIARFGAAACAGAAVYGVCVLLSDGKYIKKLIQI